MTAALDAITRKIQAGELEQAARALGDVAETDDNRAEVAFLRGLLHERAYDREAAVAQYQQAVELKPDYKEALFRAALMADLNGDDQAAIDLYERCNAGGTANVNALINLALLYEERFQLERAERCMRHVLAECPEHERAHRVFRSILSSYTMMVDEHLQRERERRDAVLDTPVTDFELSVRSRNCLRQMNIRTLGDLLRTTEAELLGYKNFGETSLNEIKVMLEQKGLRLGQALQLPESPPDEPAPNPAPPTDEASLAMSTPVSGLELSVRSRKCLQRLGVQTLGELIEHSEVELTATKNFGQTSLNEIKQQLATHGLQFKDSV